MEAAKDCAAGWVGRDDHHAIKVPAWDWRRAGGASRALQRARSWTIRVASELQQPKTTYSPWAMISILQSSKRRMLGMLHYQSCVLFCVTFSAAACCCMLRAQAVRWPPKGSRARWRLNARSVRGNGSRKRRRSRMLKTWGPYVVSTKAGKRPSEAKAAEIKGR